MTVDTVALPAVAAAAPRPNPGSWRRAWQIGTIYWVICHAGYVAVQLMALRLNPGVGGLRGLVGTWVRFDGTNYVGIAEQGYPAQTHPQFQHYGDSVWPAWPPGYPILIRAFSYVLPGGMNFAALVVSNLAALGMLVVLYRLVEQELDRDNADRTLVCLLAFPTAFFLGVAYSESLFLLLTIGALYCARRGRWWYAGALAGAASSVRVAGVTIVLALAYEYLRQRDFAWRRIRVDVLGIALAPVGLFAYMAFLWRRYDDPLMFSHVQIAWGRGSVVMPWTTLGRELRGLHLFGDPDVGVTNLIDLVALAVALALLVLCLVGPWRLRRDQLFLVIAGALPLFISILQPISDPNGPPWQSMARYVLSCTPIFLVLAKMAANRYFERFVLFVGLPLQAGLLILYLQLSWAG